MYSLVTEELSKGRYHFEWEGTHLSQDVSFCSPAEASCVATAMQGNHGCLVKCTGLYADVWYSEADNKITDTIKEGNAALLEMLKDGKISALRS